jgi:hypothetical protein
MKAVQVMVKSREITVDQHLLHPFLKLVDVEMQTEALMEVTNLPVERYYN